MSNTLILTGKELADAFRRIGLAGGDSLIVHSSFRSLGKVDGGPKTVIQALLDVIGSKGNLMLPTFNYFRPAPEPYYDPATTKCKTGIIPEVGRQWPGAVRSLHPTHSVTVIGPDAEKLTRGHLECRAVGIGSPIDRLVKINGKILLIGVGNNTNTTIHLGEEYAGTPKALWTDEPVFVKVRLPDGNIISHEIDTSTSCSAAFGAVDYVLRRNEQIRDLRLANCGMQLMLAPDVIRCVGQMIEDKADILLCTWPGCKPCTGARENLRKLGIN